MEFEQEIIIKLDPRSKTVINHKLQYRTHFHVLMISNTVRLPMAIHQYYQEYGDRL